MLSVWVIQRECQTWRGVSTDHRTMAATNKEKTLATTRDSSRQACTLGRLKPLHAGYKEPREPGGRYLCGETRWVLTTPLAMIGLCKPTLWCRGIGDEGRTKRAVLHAQ